MKTITDLTFPIVFKAEADDYISYKRSLGFKFPTDDQRKLLYMLTFIYSHNHKDVCHLTKEVVDSFLEQSNKSKPRTLHANQSFIRQYCLYLQLNGYDTYVFPDKLIQCPKDFTPYIFTKEEMYQIFDISDQIGPNKNKFINTPYIYPAVFRLLYACGTRVGETLSLKINDVDLDLGTITLRNGKNNVSRVLPLSTSLTNYLILYNQRVDRSDNNPFFFPARNGESYSPTTIRNTFRKVLMQADIRPLSNGNYPRIHDLRHTYAVHALEHSINLGMDPYCSLPALSTYMGHKGIESTEYYLRLTKQYFINVLNYTKEQADIIFPEVTSK